MSHETANQISEMRAIPATTKIRNPLMLGSRTVLVGAFPMLVESPYIDSEEATTFFGALFPEPSSVSPFYSFLTDFADLSEPGSFAIRPLLSSGFASDEGKSVS